MREVHDQAQQGPSFDELVHGGVDDEHRVVLAGDLFADELRLAVDHGRGVPIEDPAHAPGKRRIGRPADSATPHQVRLERGRHQPWVPSSGLVGRKRRSARRG